MNVKRITASVLTCYFLFAVFRFSIGLILPDLKIDLNLTQFEAGGFASAVTLAGAMTMSIAGYSSDRWGVRVTLVLGSAFLFTGTYISSIAGSYPVSLASIFLAGAGTGFLIPSVYAIMGGVKPSSRGLYVGLTSSVYNWAGFVGSWVMGINVARLGWRLSLGYLGFVGLIYTPLVWFTLRGLSVNRLNTPGSVRPSYSQMLHSRNTILLAVAMLCRALGTVTFMTWSPAFLKDSVGMDLAQAGIVLGAYSAAGGISSILTGLLADRFGEKRPMLVTLITAAFISFMFFRITSTFNITATISALVGFMAFPAWNLSTSLGQRMTDPRLVGSITGLLQNSAMAGGVVGPLLAGALMSICSPGQAMILSVSIPLLIAGLAVGPIKSKIF